MFRLLFVVGLLVVCFLTLMPNPPRLDGLGTDKLHHLVSFFGLAVCGGLGWPRARYQLPLALLILGGLIEVLQASSVVNRDLDMMDWLADAIGIVLGMSLVGLLVRLRLIAA